MQVPSPPTVPEGGILVQGAPDGATAIGAVAFTLDETETAPALVLKVTEGGNQGGDAAVILACATTKRWVGGDARPWSSTPSADCTNSVTGAVSEDGTEVSFDLAGLVTDSLVDVVIGPGTTNGEEFDGTNGSTFSLTFEPPASEDLSSQPAVSAPNTTMPSPGSPATEFDSAPSTDFNSSGSLAVPPSAASPQVPTAPPEPAEPDGTSAPPTTATGLAAPGPSVPIRSSEPFDATDLAPLIAVLLIGAAFMAASAHPAVATRFPWLALGYAAPGAAAVAPVGAGPLVLARDDEEVVFAGPVLACRGVNLSFGGLHALKDVALDVYEGEIVGLIGPNGAGKTTLMECISGFHDVDAGQVEYRGIDLLAYKPGDRAGFGIGRTLQNVRLFPYLTVVDNVRVALHRHQRSGVVSHALQLPPARKEDRWLLDEAHRIVDLVGMQSFADKFASELSYGTLRLLELACMLALKPSLLLLDEPASGISQKETEALGPLLRDIQATTGSTMLIIEHDMPLVMSLCDRIYCLDAGAVLSIGTPEEIQQDEMVAQAYLGTPHEQQKVAAAPLRSEDAEAEMLLEISGLDVFYDKVQVLYDVDFHVRRGERVALLGTNGAGKSTVLRAASGLIAPAAGSILWKGEDVTAIKAEKLVRMGLGQVPGGRGLFPTLTVAENLRMGGYIYKDESEIDAEVERVIEYFPWIAERSDQAAGTLSGGEQQQLSTARALMSRPELLMIDELSLGLAPVIIERLMETVQRLCDDEGLTVVIVEQQASFALGYTDRAYFMEKGEVRYSGPSAGLVDRSDLLRSVFLAGASAAFADAEGAIIG